MNRPNRADPHFVRHVLATVAVAAGVCGVSAALGRSDNIPLILLAAPIVGAIDATALKLKHDGVDRKRHE